VFMHLQALFVVSVVHYMVSNMLLVLGLSALFM